MATLPDIDIQDLPSDVATSIEELAASITDASPSPELEGYLRGRLDVHRRAKEESDVEDAMLDNMRAINGEYSDAKLSALESQGMAKTFLGLTGVKFRAALAWFLDIFTHEDDKTWGVRPSPEPSLPPQVMQQLTGEVVQRAATSLQQQQMPPEQIAQTLQQQAGVIVEEVQNQVLQEASKRAEKMERKIHDQLSEGGWDRSFFAFLMDVIGLKAGIIKGPIVELAWSKQWGFDEQGMPVLQSMQVPMPRFHRVSPFDAYPAPNASNFDQDFIERIKFTRESVFQLRGLEGYDQVVIEDILENYDTLSASNVDRPADIERNELEQKITTYVREKDLIEGFEFWLNVPGSLLQGFGKLRDGQGEAIDPVRGYDIVALMIADRLVHVDYNPRPAGVKPYAKTGFSPILDSFWYKGMPELAQDIQEIANACARSLVNNMGLAAGFQVVYNDVSRVPEGESITTIFPHKVHQFTNKMQSQLRPLEFVQPDSNANELLGILSQLMAWMDDATGIPAYQYGNEKASGAGRTMGGLSMLMSNSARGIKRVILAIDRDVIKPIIEAQYDWNMLNLGDPALVGDAQVVATGAVAIMMKEQMAERRMGFLQATNNPVDNKIMGVKGRAVVLRESAKTLELDGQKIVPDEKDVERMVGELDNSEQQATQAQAQLSQMQAQKLQVEMQVLQQKGQMEAQQMQLESQKIQADIQLSQGQLQLEMAKLEVEKMRIGLDQQKMQQDAQLASAKVQLDGAKVLSADRVAQAGAANQEAEVHTKAMDMADRLEKKAKERDAELAAGSSESGKPTQSK